MRRRVFRVIHLIVILIVATMVLLLMRSSIPSDKSLEVTFDFEDYTTEVGYEDVLSRRVRYVNIRSDKSENRPILVMVHGAPGGIQGFESYAKDSVLRSRFDILIYERPGYGIKDKIPESGIDIQAEVLRVLLDKLFGDENEIIFLSHSYGGAIAALASIELESFCGGHVMVAPVLDPKSEPLFWFSGFPSNRVFRNIVSPELYSASIEKLAHRSELEGLVEEWSKVNCQTVLFHGLSDWVAPPENIDFVRKKLNKTELKTISIEEKSHFILWDNEVQSEIKRALLTL